MSAQAVDSHAAWLLLLLLLLPLLCVCVNHYLRCLQLNGTSWQCGLCDAGGGGEGGALLPKHGADKGAELARPAGGGRKGESTREGVSKDAEYVRLNFTGARINSCTGALVNIT